MATHVDPPAARAILHLDMDAFYAAVEQRDHPELRGKPILVGGDPRGRGVVATASYEARPFGCRSAMPMSQAVRLCPQAIIVTPRMERYVEASRQVFEILESYTPLVEPLSIDEAFLDVTGSTRLFGEPERIAREIKRRIREETQLTGSVGVAPSKFVAKLASDLRKPDGLVVVKPYPGWPDAAPPGDADGGTRQYPAVQSFLDPLPVARLWGAGKVTQQRFDALGLRTFADVRALSEDALRQHFGEAAAEHFHALVRGIDPRPVVPDRDAKSISHETTFATDVADAQQLRAVLLAQTEHVAQRLRRHGWQARTVVLKLRTPDFKTITRRTTLPEPTDRTDLLWQAARGLLEEAGWGGRPAPAGAGRSGVPAAERDTAVGGGDAGGRSGPGGGAIRLIGVGFTQLSRAGAGQLSLFTDEQSARRQRLDRAADAIRARFGTGALTHGRPRGRSQA